MGPALSVIPIVGAVVSTIAALVAIFSPSKENETMSEISTHIEDLKKREKAEKEGRKTAEEKLEKLNERLKEGGIQPMKWPTEYELRSIREKLQYQEGYLHFAVVGVGGSGKSSLVNAFRGLRNCDFHSRVAPTDCVETTSETGRYPDLDRHAPRKWIVWYDIPGAGTLKIPEPQYFIDQGLFIFDFIVLVVDIRFTNIDIAILKNSQRFGIPTFIVRSKANQHIGNIMSDTGYDVAHARDKFVADTQKNIEKNLREAGLSSQRIYIVSKDVLCTLMQRRSSSTQHEVEGEDKPPEGLIDETELILDMVSAAYERRYRSLIRGSNTSSKALIPSLT